ncbi:Ig-like domain-containing protein, partial [Escherichia coli]|uniref:Ig-like domain-containing protein n=1 Tax=Escherichia coli TaxID=562 RepID=UPI0020222998
PYVTPPPTPLPISPHPVGTARAGQTVSVMADNGATGAPTVITGPDGTVEISVTSQTAGASSVTASINSSSQSRDVTFIADVRTA